MEELQSQLQKVEVLGDKLVTVGEKIVDCDKRRQGDREALSALRKLAVVAVPTPGPARAEAGGAGPKPPKTLWMVKPGGVFMRLPAETVYNDVSLDYDGANKEMDALHAEQKALMRSLQAAGVVPESIGQELLRAMLELKDDDSAHGGGGGAAPAPLTAAAEGGAVG